jgi:hypothetical protein
MPGRQQALIGRQAELSSLERIITGLGEGRGAVSLISGEPGIGKSALARWAADRAQDMGFPVYRGFCWEAGGAPPYWPWTQCLRALLADFPPPGAHAAQLARLLPELADQAAGGFARLKPEQARFQLLESVRALLTDAAAQQPFVMILEDLHAADDDSLSLLQYAGQHSEAAGFLLIGTFRELEARLADPSSPLWRCARDAVHLRPSALAEADVREWLEQQTGHPAREARVRQLLTTTGGNPLFLTEVLALLSSNDTGQPADLPVPGSVRQVIRQHLATLPAATYEALETASVVGREFNLPALADLLDRDESAVQETLQPAVTASLLLETRPSACRFAHVFHRDALYADLEPAHRRELHLRRARHLESQAGTGSDELWSEMAEHFMAAGAAWREDAVNAWRRAAARAGERLALAESCSLYRRALDCFGAGPTADPAERCALSLQAAAACLRAGEIDTGNQLCREAFQLARTLGDAELMAHAALTRGGSFAVGKVDPELVGFLQDARSSLECERNPGQWARLQARLAAALQPAADPEGPIRMAQDAVALARKCGDEEILFQTLTSAISALMDLAPARERRTLTTEFEALARRFDDIPARFRAHLLQFIDALELAEPAQMASAIDACERLSLRIGLPHYQWRVDSARALQSTIHGDFAEAGERIARAEASAARAGDRMAQVPLSIQSFNLRVTNTEANVDELEAAWQRVAEALSATGADDRFVRPMVAYYFCRAGAKEAAEAICPQEVIERLVGMREMSNLQWLGEYAVLRGDEDLARRAFDSLSQSQAICGHAGLYGMCWSGPVALTLARLANFLGDTDSAGAYHSEGLKVASRMGAAHLVHDSRGREAQVATDRPTGHPRPPAAVKLLPAGEYWQVIHGSRKANIRDSKGMQILARLLEAPGTEFHALDLNSPGGPAVVESGDTGAGLDARARESYRRRLEEIAEALEEARELNDPGRVDPLLAEQDALQRELSRAFGLGGRARPAGRAAERARVNVTRRVRDAIKRIAEQMPEAGRYLDSTVKTGTYCKFEPL